MQLGLGGYRQQQLQENGVESLYTRAFEPRDIDNFFEAETRNSDTTLQLGPHLPRGGENFLIPCGRSPSEQRFLTPGGGPEPERSLRSPRQWFKGQSGRTAGT
jgi:hypothetical protein